LTRVQADLALGLAGLIWGFGFVAQKTALDHIGPFTFVAARFLISALFVLPLVLRDNGLRKLKTAVPHGGNGLKLLALCIAFSIGVLFQQVGMRSTSVTNTSFITGIYIVLVPFVGALFYKTRLSFATLIASLLSLLGVWLLSAGGDIHMHFGRGDILVLLCTFGFAVQVTVLGRLANKMRLPFAISFVQYLVVTIIALILALYFEHIDWQSLIDAWLPILFAGVASGGIAYTLQAAAQQHTPSADAAIIMSSEVLFGGVGGIWLLHEKLTMIGMLGCIAVIAAIILVELAPVVRARHTRRKASA
jgi:drug/metabolite transporter (DMT)-like permease